MALRGESSALEVDLVVDTAVGFVEVLMHHPSALVLVASCHHLDYRFALNHDRAHRVNYFPLPTEDG